MESLRTARPLSPASPTAARECPRCGCRIARDNHDSHCSPCRFALTLEEHRELVLDDEPIQEHADAFAAGGVYGLAEAADCSAEEAISLAIRAGLVPRRWRSSEEKLRQLVHFEGIRHVEVADRLGVSRWTIATWRDGLGLQRKRRRSPSASA